MNNSSEPNKPGQHKADSKSKPENANQKSKQIRLSKFYGLFNVLTGIGGILAIIASTLFHGSFSIVLQIGGVIFLLFAVHVELDEKFGTRFWYVSPAVAIIVILGYIFQPEDKNMIAPKNPVQSQTVPDTSKQRGSSPKERAPRLNDISKKRPRILLDPVQVREIAAGKRLEIEIPHTNNDEAIAYNIEHKYCIKIGGTGIYDADWDSIKVPPNPRRSIAEPKTRAVFVLWTDDPLSERDAVGIANGTRKLFVFGNVTYTDRSGKTKYYRKYCFKYEPTLKAFVDYGTCNDAN